MIYGNRDFNDFIGAFLNNTGRNYNYSTTLFESPTQEEPYEINNTKDGAYLFFEAPGFNKTNLKVEMEDGVLHIEGKRTYKLNSEEKTKSLSKKFKIGLDYNTSSIEATIEDGILTVFVPNFKKQEKKRINIL